MLSDEDGAHVAFDPIGPLVQPGQTVRWRCEANYHTMTAYHPTNGNHSLGIPRDAEPWASEVLLPGETFQVTLTAEGVHDYFCAPHEHADMIGREGRDWLAVPPLVHAAFPSVEVILTQKVVPARGF